MSIAYLINQYPKVSHSFIRREIAALEAQGQVVHRFAIRACREPLVDPNDQAELANTRVVLQVGGLGLLLYSLRTMITQPVGWWRGLRLALQLGRQSQRGALIHVIYLAEACVLRRWLQVAKIQHVHAHFGTNSTMVALLCKTIGGPEYSFTVHGPEEFDRPADLALTEKITHAKFVVAISQFGRSQLYRWCHYDQWHKIHVVHCGVDQQFLQAAPIGPTPEPHLVCVGRLCEQKGQLLLLQALHKLVVDGVDCRLTLVGDGELRAPIEALIHQYGLSDRVKITGWASGREVHAAILAARALVLPSFAEGLPVVIMEALALGRPVISTYVAGIPELVEPGESGWLVPAGSIEALATAMQAALQASPSTLERMGAVGMAAVAQRHDITNEAQKLQALFQFYREDGAAEVA
jgi:colanic acid/amylovoran biosynthesis glycosyltransferase